jgi:hypothetical protein
MYHNLLKRFRNSRTERRGYAYGLGGGAIYIGDTEDLK